MRTFLERISRQRSFVRRLPVEFSRLPVVVSPDAQLKYMRPGRSGFDEVLLNAASRLVRPGDNVWDVGANVGIFTMACAARSGTGQIVAVEADIWLASLLRKTLRLPDNLGFDLSVVPAAASASAGVSKFSIAAHGRASNHLSSVPGSSQTGGAREVVEVATLPLDLLLNHYTPPNIIKIDVEGAELEVLMGMNRILSEVRPELYCEVSGSNREQFLSMIHGFDYVIRNINTGKQESVIGSNVFLSPKEKVTQTSTQAR